MANLGCLLVCTFGNFFVPVLVAAHTVNNSDLAMNKALKMRVMKVILKIRIFLCLVTGHKNILTKKNYK